MRATPKSLRSRVIPPLVASLALLAHVTLMYKAVLRHTAGNVSYPVDDTFIHLALAKQIAMNGVYGVTPHEFTAASSSIGWPLLLAAVMKISGATPWLPLVLNGVLAIGVFFAADRAVHRLAPDVTTATSTIIALLVMAFTPMATLVVLGMEHTAHSLATIAFVTVSATWLAADANDANDAKPWWRSVLPVAAWAGATTLWRYEGMFPVALVCALALARRRGRPAMLIAMGGALPILLFGLYSKAHGSHFLPTPVLLKGRHFDLRDATAYFDLLGGDLLDRFGTEGYALAIAAACAALAFYLIRREGFWTTNVLACLLVLGMILMHLELASVGWFYRYESYLLATGITVVGSTLARLLPPRRELWRVCRAQPIVSTAAGIGMVVLAAPLCRRAVQANNNTPQACQNIYEQQMQSARFLVASFPHERVAVNDIGAVAWVGNDHVVDLVGLATLPVAEAKSLKLEKPLAPADVVRLTQGVKAAIVYDEWFKDNLPPTWLRVARWKIDNNKSCAFPTVAIYATDPSSYASVIDALRAYAPSLPPTVTAEGRYADHPTAPDRLRAGDRVVVETSVAQTSGSYLIEPDGTIPLRGYGATLVRDLTPAEAPAEIQKRLAGKSSPFGDAKIERVTRVAMRGPSIHVGGAVGSSGEVQAFPLTLDAAIAAAGPSASADPAGAWVFRERPDGFVKMTRAELADGALVDGDVVVVPAAGAAGAAGARAP
jgi:protein involved in polysaccharide export with SLBB domain